MTAARAARRPRRHRTLPDRFPSEVASPGGFWISYVRRAILQRDAIQAAMVKAVDDEPLFFGMLHGRHALDESITDAYARIQQLGDLLRVLPTRRGAA